MKLTELPPRALAIDFAEHERILLSGGPGSGTLDAALQRAAALGLEPAVVDLSGVYEHARALDVFESALAEAPDVSRPAVITGATAVTLSAPGVLADLHDIASARALCVLADAPAPPGWRHLLLAPWQDASGAPDTSLRDRLVAAAAPSVLAPPTVDAWAERCDGWPLAADAAGGLLRDFGSDVALDPRLWLNAPLEGGGSLAAVLEDSFDALEPDEQELLRALLSRGPALRGPELAALQQERGVSPTVPHALRCAGWVREVRTARAVYWWVPWLRVHWLHAAEEEPLDAERDLSAWASPAVARLSAALARELVEGSMIAPEEIGVFRRLSVWGVASDDPNAKIGHDLLRGLAGIASGDLAGACIALEEAWWEAMERDLAPEQTAAALLLAESFARRSDGRRALRQLDATHAAPESLAELRVELLRYALSGGEGAGHEARRLDRALAATDPERWHFAAQIALGALLDADDTAAHGRLVDRVTEFVAVDDGPAWLRAHVAATHLARGETVRAAELLRGLEERGPRWHIAAADLALLCGDAASAERSAKRAIRLARERGETAPVLSGHLRRMLVELSLSARCTDNALFEANLAASRLGRRDARALVAALTEDTPRYEAPEGASLVLAAFAHRLSGTLPPAVGVPSPGAPVDMAAWLAHGIAAREAELELEDVNTDPEALVVTGDFLAARWGGEVHDLTKFALFSRMLRCLVEQRGAAPGEGVSADALIEAIWPDERMTPESANNRFHKTLSTFRKRFGKAFVERVDGAYRLPPEAPVVMLRGRAIAGYAPPASGWTHHEASARTLGED